MCKGTFDVMDIIVEIIAELMAVFIIKRHDMRRKSYEKNQEVHRGTAVSDSISLQWRWEVDLTQA